MSDWGRPKGNVNRAPLRSVVGWNFNWGGVHPLVKLECGHTMLHLDGMNTPKKKRCRKCAES